MSRAIFQSASLGRAALRVGSRGSPGGTAAGAVGRATRRFAVSTPGLHHEAVSSSSYWRQQHSWFGRLAVAVAGSMSVLAVLQLKSVEELFPSLVKEVTSTSPKQIEDFYTFESEESLGRGQFGTVSTATDKATGEVVAVKRVPRSKTTEKNFREEAEVHREVGSHPNVVGLKGVFADDDCWYVVMELARGGELFDRLTTEGVVLPADEVRSLLRETAGAVAYMHDRGIVHGDIKPENVLLTTPAATATTTTTTASAAAAATATATVASRASDDPVGASRSSKGATSRFVQAEAEGKLEQEGGGGSGLGKVLLADFGSSFRLREGSANGGKLVKEYTVAYSAPEVVENSLDVDHKADIWSLGVIAYVMVKGHHPFDPSSEADDDEIAESIINSEPDWDGLDSQAAQLIRRMLARDPVDRPTAEEVLRSSWLCAPSAKQGQ